jgi:hypothetical protein
VRAQPAILCFPSRALNPGSIRRQRPHLPQESVSSHFTLRKCNSLCSFLSISQWNELSTGGSRL